MKRAILIVFVFLALLVLIVFSVAWRSPSSFDALIHSDEAYPLMSWDDYAKIAYEVEPPVILDVGSLNSGAALFLGMTHSSDPEHPQFETIRQEYRKFEPTIALIEGRMGFFIPGLMNPIESFGESGLLAALAKEEKIPVYSWELSKADEIEALRVTHSQEQVALFIILRPYTSQSSERRLEGGDAFAQKYISERGQRAGLDSVIASIADMDRIWGRDFPEEDDWRELRFSTAMPSYLGELFEQANNVRDYHLLDTVHRLTEEGHRVIVTAGWSHVVRIAPVYTEE